MAVKKMLNKIVREYALLMLSTACSHLQQMLYTQPATLDLQLERRR